MIEKDFIPYKLALELKQLGFDEPCLGVYFNSTQELHIGKTINQHTKDVRTLAPTYSQAFRWFDENTSISGFVVPSVKENYFDWEICHEDESTINSDEYFICREEAELACLKELIELVKTYGGNNEKRNKTIRN